MLTLQDLMSFVSQNSHLSPDTVLLVAKDNLAENEDDNTGIPVSQIVHERLSDNPQDLGVIYILTGDQQ